VTTWRRCRTKGSVAPAAIPPRRSAVHATALLRTEATRCVMSTWLCVRRYSGPRQRGSTGQCLSRSRASRDKGSSAMRRAPLPRLANSTDLRSPLYLTRSHLSLSHSSTHSFASQALLRACLSPSVSLSLRRSFPVSFPSTTTINPPPYCRTPPPATGTAWSTVRLGCSGSVVSRICLVVMSHAHIQPGQRPAPDRHWALKADDGEPFIKQALDAGINFFDTAEIPTWLQTSYIASTPTRRWRNRCARCTTSLSPARCATSARRLCTRGSSRRCRRWRSATDGRSSPSTNFTSPSTARRSVT
jgi:hypothetical protein